MCISDVNNVYPVYMYILNDFNLLCLFSAGVHLECGTGLLSAFFRDGKALCTDTRRSASFPDSDPLLVFYVTRSTEK